MFHLFNEVYLADHTGYMKGEQNIILSTLIHEDYLPGQCLHHADSLEDLLSREYQNNLQKFIDYLKSLEGKVIIYLNHQDFEYLQMTLWVSILRNPKAQTVKTLHDIFIDSARLHYSFDKRYFTSSDNIRNWPRHTLEELEARLKDVYTLDFTGVRLGIEYYLPYAKDKKSKAYQTLTERLYQIALKHFYRECLDMRECILSYGYLFLDSEPGKLNDTLKGLEDLTFVMDEKFPSGDLGYLTRYYPVSAFQALYDKVVGRHALFGSATTLSTALGDENLDILLEAELDAGIHGVLLNAHDDTRINTYLVSYFYRLLQSDTETLKAFLLKERYV